jgi:hypothetical protein
MAVLLRYLQVPGSNSDPGTEYSEGFHCFSQFLQASAEIVPHMRIRPFLFTPFLIHYSLIILSIDSIHSEVLTVSLNKPHITKCTYGVTYYVLTTLFSIRYIGRGGKCFIVFVSLCIVYCFECCVLFFVMYVILLCVIVPLPPDINPLAVINYIYIYIYI